MTYFLLHLVNFNPLDGPSAYKVIIRGLKDLFLQIPINDINQTCYDRTLLYCR